MLQTSKTHSPITHLRRDLAMFAGVFVVVLGGVIALYLYDLKTGYVGDFSSQLFHWLID